MRYSIIIPVYNAEKTLNRCLDSIINQHFDDYELILVDDGSKDCSLNICKAYADRYDNINFLSKENGGVSSARNLGLNNAKGQYILFVDSDDYVEANYFQTILDSEIRNGLTVFTYSWIKTNGKFKRQLSKNLLNENYDLFHKVKELLLSRTINSPYAKIFDKSLIDAIGLRFDERMPVAEDFNFCLKYLMNCSEVGIIDKSIYCYDVTNGESLVRSRKQGLIDIYPIVFDYAYNTINESSFSKQEKYQLFRIWDKLHTDSFATCVMEELKDDEKKPREIKNEIKVMCDKFYSAYKPQYGYQNIVHFFVRLCIKYKLSELLYCFGTIYSNFRR